MNRKPIFDAVRGMLGRPFDQREVDTLDRAIDRSLPSLSCDDQPAPFRLGDAGMALIKKWEGCAKRRPDGRFDAYPDPGSRDGTPWTIGWGATGPDIRQGLVWTQEQCDARFAADVERYVQEVARFLGGAVTTPNQFDALVSFHYNTGAVAKSSLGRLHRQGQFAAAEREFARWIYNDGKPMNGLRSRRAEEAELYAAA